MPPMRWRTAAISTWTLSRLWENAKEDSTEQGLKRNEDNNGEADEQAGEDLGGCGNKTGDEFLKGYKDKKGGENLHGKKNKKGKEDFHGDAGNKGNEKRKGDRDEAVGQGMSGYEDKKGNEEGKQDLKSDEVRSVKGCGGSARWRCFHCWTHLQNRGERCRYCKEKTIAKMYEPQF